MFSLTNLNTRNTSSVMRIIITVIAVCITVYMAFAQNVDSLTLATYTYSTNTRLQNLAPLAAHLSKTLGMSVRVKSFPDPPSLARGIESGEVDVAVMNTFGYLLLDANRTKAAHTGIPIATFHIPKGQSSNYRTIILARSATNSTKAKSDKAWETTRWQEIREKALGLRIVFVSPGSTTGNLVPRLYLASKGLTNVEKQFQSVVYAGTHAEALKMLVDGKADIVALATEEYDKFLGKSPETASMLETLWLSDDIKLGPIVLRSTLPKHIQRAISKQVVGAERTAHEAFTAVRDGWTEAKKADAFVNITDRYYDDIRAMFGDKRVAAELIEKFAK